MMFALSLQAIADVTGGQLMGDDIQVRSICTDTRAITRDSAFLALRGERFDGHEFVAEAQAKGALAAVVSREVSAALPQVVVADGQRALGQIAALNRQAFTGPVIALTGSCGKTSCKEMLASILGQSFRVLATRGNLNNEIGVPLTLLEIAPEHDCAVIEMGAAKPGDIAYLCDFAQPDIALITNAAPAHLERLGSLEAVANTKGGVYRALKSSGVAIINADDRFAGQWRASTAAKTVLTTSCHSESADFYARDIAVSADGTTFRLHCPEGEVEIQLPLLGSAMVANALLAAAAATAAGASLKDIVIGLAAVRAVKGRLSVSRFDDLTLIDDSYNANPASVKAAIDVLGAFPERRLLILGDMAELGADALALHREIGTYAAKAGIQRVLTVGKLSAATAEAAGAIGQHYTQKSDLMADLTKQLQPGDCLLVKGSRSAAMDEIVEALASTRITRGTLSC